MDNSEIIRAWKDGGYRTSLTAGESAACPSHPAGAIEMAEDELELVFGAMPPTTQQCSMGHCTAGCSLSGHCGSTLVVSCLTSAEFCL